MEYNQIIIDYNLIPLNGREMIILSIWAGLKPQRR
jgi:hypothetical protein